MPRNNPIEDNNPPPASPEPSPEQHIDDGIVPDGKDRNEPIQLQNDLISRNIDLFKERNTLIDAGTGLLNQQKSTQEQINELLQENQSLRGVTGEQSDDVLKGAAAYDDLSTAVNQNGDVTKDLKGQVDALNTALESNADINAQVVDGLEKERDTRQQVNDTLVERRQLDQDQGQRLIAAQKDVSDSAAEVEASIEQIRKAAADSFKDVIKGTESVGDAFQNLADRITDILLDLALRELLTPGNAGFSDLFGTIFGGLGSVIGGGIGSGAASSAASLQRATAAGAFTTFRPTGGAFGFHSGGVVGIDGAPRFHTGGVTGLAPDEIPIIAQRGEEVLTRNDPRHRDNGGLGGGAPNITVNNIISFPNARNTQEAREAGSEIAAKAAAAAQRGMARKGLG